MLKNRNKINFVTICYWLSILCLSAKSNVQALSIEKAHTSENDVGHNEHIGSGNALQSDATAHNFSPRLEYNNEWKPVGRGDPLKNDPTYDYSPPALERVRYWRAENETNNHKHQNKKKDYAINNKKEILLLGMPSERHRGQSIHGETSILQPKYTSIRRSYYAHQHQLPTHLMPPPMQTLSPSAHMMKNGGSIEYRHSMPSSTTTAIAMMHTKPYSSTPWMASMPTSVSLSPSSLPSMMHRQTSHMHINHDHRHQSESINQFSYTRPTSFTPHNFIESNQNSFKARKPWLHELLQKEVVKLPPKPIVHKYSTDYEQMSSSMGSIISTTYPPVSFVPMPSTTPQTTTSTSTATTTTTEHVHTRTSPVYFTTTTPTAAALAQNHQFMNSPSTPSSNRLLIPSTSNLIHRPTVTPIEMTTDPLFKHYKQPAQPLLGPMYLIIEGHSKVKTYGKDELDPHQPKIVPIIPNREPVVRRADPNKKPETTVSLQVKHLHTKVTIPATEKSTTSTTTTTKVPKANKPTTTKTTSSSTTIKTTTTTPTMTMQKTDDTTKLNTQFPTTELPTGMGGFFDFLDSSLGNLFREGSTGTETGEIGDHNSPQENMMHPTTTPSASSPHQVTTAITTKATPIEARIGTHAESIESLIDFEEEELSDDKVTTEPVPRDVRQVFDYDQLPESRLKDRIDVNSAEDNDENSADIEEAVIGLHDDTGEDLDLMLKDVESFAPEEYDDASHELIERIDKLIDDNDNDEADFEELISTEVDADEDMEMRRTKEV